jgi:hypothetical protein
LHSYKICQKAIQLNNMLKLNFTVDKYHLAYKYVLKYFGDATDVPQDWQDLKYLLVSKYEHYAAFLFFVPVDAGHGLLWFNLNKGADIIRDREMVMKIFEEIFASDVFMKAYLETETYRARLEKIWADGSEYIKKYEKVIKLNVNAEATVLVLHQSIETGSYIGKNIIEWGNPDLYENYQLIGLCHEFLHVLTEKQYNETKTEEDKWLLHSLIYLSADEELRQVINGENGYFMSGVVDRYHPLLIETAKRSLPYWEKYVKGESRSNIVDLYESLR